MRTCGAAGVWVLSVLVCPCWAGDDYSLLEELKKQPEPPVLGYSSHGIGNAAVQDALARDYQRVGFNGAQHGFAMGARLPYKTLYSLHCDMGMAAKLRYRDRNGKVVERWSHYGDIYAPANVDYVAGYIRRAMDRHGRENFCKLGGRYVIITADESDLLRSKFFHTMVSPAREKAWRQYVRKHYGDRSPGKDTNGDGRTYNAVSVHKVASWDRVKLPPFATRFREPRIWLAYRQFLCEHMYGFIRGVEAKANADGLPVMLGFSGHGSLYHPGGAAAAGGADLWLQSQDRLFAQESVIPQWPFQAALFFASQDRLSREHGLPVFSWSWFWPNTDEYQRWGGYGEDTVERVFAQIFGHEVHGLLHWVYQMALHRRMPHMATTAFWHHWFRKHWGFLKASHPVEAQVALLYPKTTANFYDVYRYPKQDYLWSVQALLDLQVPFTVLTEEEVQAKGVGPYRALLVMSTERVPRGVAKAIEAFIEKGGMVFADADSLSMDADGLALDILRRRFGVQLVRKRKLRVPYLASVLSREEELWVQARGKGTDAPLPPTTPYGAAQGAIDEDKPRWIDMAIPWPLPRLRTYSDILTAKVVGNGRVLATHDGQPVMIETERTLWTGFRPGSDLCATYPRRRMHLTGEPVAKDWGKVELLSAEARRAYVDIFARLLDKAGVTRPATVTRGARLARNIDVYVRKHEQTGGLMLILIDHDLDVTGAPDRYRVTCPLVRDGFRAWDLSANKPLEWKGRGVVELRVPEHRAKYVVMAPPKQVAQLADVQRRLLAMDFTPEPVPLGVVGGPVEPPVPTPQLVGGVTHRALPDGVVAQAMVAVTNNGPARVGEPIVVPGSVLTGAMPFSAVRGVRLVKGVCQWDDLDGDGVVSAGDEIAWQADLSAGKRVVFTLEFLRKPAPAATGKAFQARVTPSSTAVVDGKRRLFALDAQGQWALRGVTLANGTTIHTPPHPGFVFDFGWHRHRKAKLTLREMKRVTDGPVRKRIRVRFGNDSPAVDSVATYTVYRGQPADENRVYVTAVHHVKEAIDFITPPVLTAKDMDDHVARMSGSPEVAKVKATLEHMYRSPVGAGGLLGLARCGDVHYVDALGRVFQRDEGACLMVPSFGGWIAQTHRGGSVVQVSLRRMHGILSGPLLRYERDGVLVMPGGALLTRAYVHHDDPNRDTFVDTRIEPGTQWRLHALVGVRKGYDEARCRAERRAFADPPSVEVNTIVLPSVKR